MNTLIFILVNLLEVSEQTDFPIHPLHYHPNYQVEAQEVYSFLK